MLKILRSILSRITPASDPAGDGSGNKQRRKAEGHHGADLTSVGHPSKTSCDLNSFITIDSQFVPNHYFWLVSCDDECSSSQLNLGELLRTAYQVLSGGVPSGPP